MIRADDQAKLEIKDSERGQQPDEPRLLTEAASDLMLVVRGVETKSTDAVRLKRMGVCEGRCIQIVQTGDPLIIRVAGCRVGVSRHLARHVWVQLAEASEKPLRSRKEGT